MEGTAGAPPQRVCPKCARISWATGPRCPYCRGRFRRTTTATFAWMLALAVVVVLAAVAGMLVYAGHEARSELNDRADQIQNDVNRQFDQLRTDVNRQIQEQASATPSATPTPTPATTPSPSPSASATKTPSPSATASPTIQP
jgi:outer membrane murein-binding lipoprotein Lpp